MRAVAWRRRSAQAGNRWDGFVTITVHDKNGAPVVGATVEGSWDTGDTSSAVTDGYGQCTVSNRQI